MNHGDIPVTALVDFQRHAVSAYPNVAVGHIRDGKYHASILVGSVDEVQATCRSKPNGEAYPDQADMDFQLLMGIPMGIVSTDGKNAGPPLFWGDALPIAPIIGRTFVHGVWDCYSCVRDAFRMGKEGLAGQGMGRWPYPSITLPEVPRSDSWWDGSQDLYVDHLKPVGFKEIPAEQVRPGDGFLLKIRSNKLNHAGVVVDDNAILHHIPSRLSRRELGGLWAQKVSMWVRYEG